MISGPENIAWLAGTRIGFYSAAHKALQVSGAVSQ